MYTINNSLSITDYGIRSLTGLKKMYSEILRIFIDVFLTIDTISYHQWFHDFFKMLQLLAGKYQPGAKQAVQ